MEIKIGTDIVSIKKFAKSQKAGGKNFLDRIFYTVELVQAPSIETLAGLFAAKEATLKALSLKPGEWKMIDVTKDNLGRPKIGLSNFSRKIISQDISISHDGEYALAMAVFCLEDKNSI